MKRTFSHPPREESPRMWRSLAERENVPGFSAVLEREFATGEAPSTLSKRDFLKLTGASAAIASAALAGCRRPEAYLVPFTKGVEWTIPGKFLYYATAMPSRGGAIPLIVTTADGRPTKVEGNPLHPASNGGTDGYAQASILDLYDPHRSRRFLRGGREATAAEFDALIDGLAAAPGGGLAILAERKLSPTRDRLRAAVEAKHPGVVWCEYEPLGNEAVLAAGSASFGEGVSVLPKFERADVILALDDDFMDASAHGAGYAAGFFARRNPDQKGAPMNRLYVVENHYTGAGGLADHRLRCKASHIGEFARRLAEVVASKTGSSSLSALVTAAPQNPAAPLDPAWIAGCADDLAAHAGRGIVVVGALQPAWVQALVHGINDALGNLGTTLLALPVSENPSAPIASLASSITSGAVKTLLILGGNPAYNAPAELGFAELLKSVPQSLRVGLFEDETSKICSWHVPAAHYLETWSDALAFDGTHTVIQPMVLPLWGGLGELELLARLAGLPAPEGPQLVMETFATRAGLPSPARQVPPPATTNMPASEPALGFALAKDQEKWSAFLRTGFLNGSAPAPVDLTFNPAGAATLMAGAKPLAAGLELVFLQSGSVDDGRYANNSWLQETPDFETKVTWDNVALVSPATAKRLGIRANNFSPLYGVSALSGKGNEVDYDIVADIIEMSSGGRSIRAAALIAPGHADDSLSLALGYGRAGVSALIDNVGFDAYPLRTSDTPRFANGVEVRHTGETYPLARTQEHQSMEGRDLFREGTADLYKNDPTFARYIGMDSHIPENVSLFTHPKLDAQEQWGMTVDLNSCFGCNACVVACQAENNVPVVGKEQVRRNRDMAWIRIDRYFAGEPEDPEMLAQAVMCQHCENAPCETVCPVNATVHSEDGLNLMAYNRCIGTRYCANNCPWKVRRFNYFNYNERPLDQLYWGPLAPKGVADSLKMVKNPNVTVRMRGVMEKCTFCIQRIEEAKISRIVEAGPRDKYEVPIREFQSACQQACPSKAIVFGNISDPNSHVSRLRAGERNYTMLNYLNIAPRVSYLARIKNPNPKMPGAELVGLANGAPHHAGHTGDPIAAPGHEAPHEAGHKTEDPHGH